MSTLTTSSDRRVLCEITVYLGARTSYDALGGIEYKKDKDSLQNDYVNSKVSHLLMQFFLSKLRQEVRNELSSSFLKWDKKIASGKLVRPENPQFTKNELISKIESFIEKHSLFIRETIFNRFNEVKVDLKNRMRNDLSTLTAEEIFSKYTIEDSELKARIVKWKAKLFPF